MIVDSSALVAIALNQESADDMLTTLATVASPRVSAANLLETYMVIDRRSGAEAEAVIAEAITPLGLIVEPVTVAQVNIARAAWARYGKGRHPARLNYGDCSAYALAKAMNEPLLFIGNDFSRTDIAQAL